MTHRFSITVNKQSMTSEQVETVLLLLLGEGARALGHTIGSTGSLPIKLEKLRTRSIDPSKPVGDQE
jgi:hypothetical protein